MTHPTLQEAAMGLLGALSLWAAALPMLLAGRAEMAFSIYVFQEVMR
jgi:hypothetical protein